MKICILTPRFPFPENGGDVLRINNIARYLKNRGHELVLVSFTDYEQSDLQLAKALYDSVYIIKRNRVLSLVNGIKSMLCGHPLQCGYYSSGTYYSLLRQVVAKEQPDLFLSHLLRMVPYLEKMGVQSKSIVEMTDALSKTYRLSSGAKGSMLHKIAYFCEEKLIARYEKKVVGAFPKVVLVSQNDVDYLRDVMDGHATSLAMHTNGVDCMKTLPATCNSKKISFIGNMRTLQNQDAVFHFVNDIFPLILKSVPDARFYIVGAQPPQSIRSLASHNVVVTGFVDDLEAVVADSSVVVAPVRVAAGIQNKVLVAMGCGVPVVMSSLISSAIPELHHGENCMISDDDVDFAHLCMKIMSDASLRAKLSVNGYNTVSDSYSWFSKLDGYENI